MVSDVAYTLRTLPRLSSCSPGRSMDVSAPDIDVGVQSGGRDRREMDRPPASLQIFRSSVWALGYGSS